jgi:hypothetical protein
MARPISPATNNGHDAFRIIMGKSSVDANQEDAGRGRQTKPHRQFTEILVLRDDQSLFLVGNP